MCTPHKNPRILKSEDFPASNPKIFKILGFDTTDRIKSGLSIVLSRYCSRYLSRSTNITPTFFRQKMQEVQLLSAWATIFLAFLNVSYQPMECDLTEMLAYPALHTTSSLH